MLVEVAGHYTYVGAVHVLILLSATTVRIITGTATDITEGTADTEATIVRGGAIRIGRATGTIRDQASGFIHRIRQSIARRFG